MRRITMLRSCKWRAFCFVAVLLCLHLDYSAQSQLGKVSYIPYADAQPIVEASSETLPADLKAISSDKLGVTWLEWVKHRDAEIRSRLIQGDEDSLVNFLLFGTSYTKQPRISGRELVLLQGDDGSS